MGLLGRVQATYRAATGRPSAGALVAQTQAVVDALNRMGDQGLGLFASDEDLGVYNERVSRKLDAVGACQDLLANAIAGLRINVYAADGTLANDLPEAKMLNGRWGLHHTAYQAKRRLMLNVLRHGAGFVWPIRLPEGGIVGLEVLDSEKVRVATRAFERPHLPGELDFSKEYTYMADGFGSVTFPPSAVAALFFAEETDDLQWRPPLEPIWPIVRAGLGVTNFSASYYFTGATPHLVFHIESAKDLKGMKTAEVDMVKAVNQMLRDNARGLMLPSGIKVQVIPRNSEQAETVEQRKFAVEAVCRRYQVPIQLVQRSESGQLQVYEQVALNFVRITLKRWCDEIATSLGGLLWPDGSYWCELDREPLTRGDFLSQVAGYTRLQLQGNLSVNEVRAKFNEQPIDEDWADEHFAQGAMAPLDMLQLQFAAKLMGSKGTPDQLPGEGSTVQGAGEGMDPMDTVEGIAAGDSTLEVPSVEVGERNRLNGSRA